VSDTTVAPTPRYWSARALAVAIPALELFIFCLLLAILLIVGAGVVARSVLNASLSWSGELASWALVWLTFTGMALGQAQNRHIALGFLAAKLPRRGQAALQLLIDLIVAYTTFMLLFASIRGDRCLGARPETRQLA
jgi:TRAP-type C4-dicarboxylate transport system permease small subunit